MTVGSRELRVKVNPGTGKGVPLLLMNGIGARLELLEPFVDHLSSDREVIRFDPPGIGASAAGAPYRARGLSRMIAAVVVQLGYDEVDVLGISWGGGLAQQFAFSHKELCRRLVLVSTGTGSIMVPPHPRVVSKMLTPRRYTDPQFLAEAAADLYGGSMRTNAAAILAEVPAEVMMRSSRGYFMQLAACVGWTSIGLLPFVKAPTLVLCGDDDPLIPVANARILHKLIPNSKLEIFDGGHLALVTEASTLAPMVERFLDA